MRENSIVFFELEFMIIVCRHFLLAGEEEMKDVNKWFWIIVNGE
jgi:hypothetical protein